MKIVAAFNVPFYGVERYQAGQAVAQLESMEGVEAVRFLQAMEGDPQYALEIECAEEVLDSVISRVKVMTGQYSAYISGLVIRTFRQLA